MKKSDEFFSGKHGPLLIAEIGGNHEGNFEYAKQLTEYAIQSDVDFIKYQIYTGDSLVSKIEGKQRNEHFKKFELTKAQHIELATQVLNAGKGYMASVWDLNALSWIDEYMTIYKIGSGDLTAYPVLEVISKIGKPIILSTGLSTQKEVLETIDFIQGINDIYRNPNYLAILQCTSMYPIEPKYANLLVIETLKKVTDLTIGYSNHTIGNKALLYAYLIGAKILEFHFTDCAENRSFRDHQISLTKEGVLELISEIKEIQIYKGDGIKQPMDIETDNGHDISFRRALYLNKNMKKGDVIDYNDLIALRPLVGIDARCYKKILGKKLKIDKKAFEKINWEDLI